MHPASDSLPAPPTAAETARRFGRLVVVGGLTSGLITAGLATLRAVLDGPTHPVTIVLAATSLGLTATGLAGHLGGPIHLLGPLICLFGLLGTTSMALAEAGLWSESLFWLPFIPLVCTFLCEPQWILRVGVAVALCVGILFGAHVLELSTVHVASMDVVILRANGLLGAGIFAAVVAAGWARKNRREAAMERRLIVGDEQARFFAVLQHLPIGVALIGPDGETRYTNSAARMLLDATDLDVPAAVAIDRLHERMHEEGRGQPVAVQRRPMQQVLAGGPAASVVLVGAEEGATDSLFLSAMRVQDSSGGDGLALVTLQDLTRLRELQRRVQHVQRIETLGSLAGSVAHDFNNMLAAILSAAHFAQAEVPEDSEAFESIGEAIDAARVGRNVVRRLLAFSRQERVEPATLDTSEQVAHAIALMRRLLPNEVVLDETKTTDWLVHADPGSLEQVVVNLALNARDAMPDGGTITVSVEGVTLTADEPRPMGLPTGDYAVITVADTGTGMPADVLERATEPFFTTKGGQGTGLGLSTCAGIARQIGGALVLQSEEGVGTTARFFVPRFEGELKPRKPTVQPTPTRCTVMVVDDEPLVLRTTSRLLRRRNYDVLSAASGTEALGLVQDGARPDVVLSDVSMPGMDGPELLERLQPQLPGAVFVLMSGFYTSEQLAGRAHIAKVVMSKPFTPEKIISVIEQARDA